MCSRTALQVALRKTARVFKGTGNYLELLIIVSIQTYLVYL